MFNDYNSYKFYLNPCAMIFLFSKESFMFISEVQNTHTGLDVYRAEVLVVRHIQVREIFGDYVGLG